MIFALCTLGALAVVYICTPSPNPKVRPTQFQHRHPETAKRRTVRFED